MMPGAASSHQVTCEVCETPQQPASVCANCGMPLKVPRGMAKTGDPVIERLPGFESTLQDAVPELPSVAVPGLEATRVEPVPELVAPAIEGFEATQQLLVIDLPGEDERLAELEVTVSDFDRSAPVDALNPLDCPYCGFRQKDGRICNNCGRMRSRVLANRGARDDAQMVSCRACGARVSRSGVVCSDCGQPLPSES